VGVIQVMNRHGRISDVDEAWFRAPDNRDHIRDAGLHEVKWPVGNMLGLNQAARLPVVVGDGKVVTKEFSGGTFVVVKIGQRKGGEPMYWLATQPKLKPTMPLTQSHIDKNFRLIGLTTPNTIPDCPLPALAPKAHKAPKAPAGYDPRPMRPKVAPVPKQPEEMTMVEIAQLRRQGAKIKVA